MSLCRADPEDPIFCFMDKKRSEGKHFYVYTVAGAAKFLRIYYARVKQYLNQMETASASVSPNWKDASLEQREAKPSLIASVHSLPALSRALQARRSRLLLTVMMGCAIPPNCQIFLLWACLLCVFLCRFFLNFFAMPSWNIFAGLQLCKMWYICPACHYDAL